MTGTAAVARRRRRPAEGLSALLVVLLLPALSLAPSGAREQSAGAAAAAGSIARLGSKDLADWPQRSGGTVPSAATAPAGATRRSAASALASGAVSPGWLVQAHSQAASASRAPAPGTAPFAWLAQASSTAGVGPVAQPSPTAQPSPPPGSIVIPAATAPVAPAPILADAAFAKLIATASLETLDPLCRQLAADNATVRLRLVRERLLALHPAPQPLEVVLANADVLLSCQAPAGALTVLDRYGPAPGAEQVQWLTLQWRAANAALDHQRAALALERLASERYGRLESLALPIQRRLDGSVITRSALEVMADHLEGLGQRRSAGQLLLLSRQSDTGASERLQQAIRLLADLPPQELDLLLERALEQAAAAGAWSLVSELLTTQAALPASVSGSQRAIERQLRLTRRLDDAYGEWRLRRQDPAAASRSLELEQKLRSPRAPGGHAADLPRPVAGAGAAAQPAGLAPPSPAAAPASSFAPEPAPVPSPAPSLSSP